MAIPADETRGGEVDDKTVIPPSDSAPKGEESFHEDFIKDLSTFEEGKIVEGSIVAIAEDSVFVDIGYKSEGEIRKSEFKDTPEPGEKISVMIMRMENRDGKLILSKQKADTHLRWNAVRQAYDENLPVEGRVVNTVKGGFKVQIEDTFDAFLPSSQTGLRRSDDQDSIIGETLPLLIDKIERKNNIVVSHRKYLNGLREKQVAEFFSTQQVGDVVNGVVKDIVSYGAFVDLGGLDGLLHINDLTWGRANDPKKYLTRGEEIRCQILNMDEENRKVSLGMKQLTPDPWLTFESRYEREAVYRGTVTKLTNFGAFVELEPGIEGLLHISELSWTRRVNHPKDVLSVGEDVSVMILDYNLSEKTVSLGLKQVLPNPWDDLDVRYPVGSKITGEITSIAKFGLFVEIEEGIEGLIHIDDISWIKQTKNPTSGYKKGQKVDAIVISVDKEARKIKLGLKQLQENPWKSLKEKHPKGSVVTGKVTSIADFGVFLQVDEDIEGLIHVSQLANERVEDPASRFKVGDELKATVLDIDENKKKVTLSIRDYQNRLEAKEINKYIEDDTEDTGSMPLGDLIDLSKIGK
jgi:small subunit ribosomal protein S1